MQMGSKDRGYQENIDYKYFVVTKGDNVAFCDIKIDIKI
jgi:hypothetical protein